ncbi:hypothetical protein QP168_03655 [Aerococcus urinae]|uniref:Uncharacterized protein n=1 Tax=Aerococcus mictus TaxID=2976810 RepID=A0A9Q4DBE0_9LACT|nr:MULTISPECIES: hypothetical protein [Aerococcus]MBU5609470.1 hypothetical protein [Aerococcus urinae]MCY3064360.1 hypothetical protein [Aerococcus mictus]MCY3065292.1 hypothetical protein [Aerococcus mictus]MCY3068980.1 hypothetical protein [Aerococcus mictus]MCY3069994.1 hypothetical protein [Aerococcus mictus]
MGLLNKDKTKWKKSIKKRLSVKNISPGGIEKQAKLCHDIIERTKERGCQYGKEKMASAS